MATDLLILPLRLIRSAPAQKAEAKPVGWTHRERSQGGPVMGRHEVASLPSGTGWRLGRSRERASPFRAKFDQSGQFQTGRVTAQAVSGALLSGY